MANEDATFRAASAACAVIGPVSTDPLVNAVLNTATVVTIRVAVAQVKRPCAVSRKNTSSVCRLFHRVLNLPARYPPTADAIHWVTMSQIPAAIVKVVGVAPTPGQGDTPASPKPDPTLQSQHVALTGDLPSPIAPPSGCVFRTRCPHAIDACAQAVPSLDEVASGHQVACIRKELFMMKVAA